MVRRRSCNSAYEQGILKIYEDIYCHCHPARVDDFLSRLERVEQESPDSIGIGEILTLSDAQEGLTEAQIKEIKKKLNPPQKYTDDYPLVDYGAHSGPNPVEQCIQEFKNVFNYINTLSQLAILNLKFPYDPIIGTMGKLKHKLLIHCGAGKGRTGSVLIGVICLREGISFDEGLRKLKKHSPYIYPDTSNQRQAIKKMFQSC